MTATAKNISNLVLHNRLSEQDLEREFLQSLQSRKIAPKFLYCGKKESEGWRKLCKERSYRYYHRETELLKKSAGIITKKIFATPGQNYNFISLGIGNGEKDAILLESFTHHGRVNFFPVDVSEDMIRQGLQHIRPNIHTGVEGYVEDFGNIDHLLEHIRGEHFSNHLMVMLGNTLAGAQDMSSFHLLRKSMQNNDFILLGFMLDQTGKQKNNLHAVRSMIEMYSSVAFQKFAFTPLERVGMNTSQGNFEIDYGPNPLYPYLNTIEIFFGLHKSSSVAYQNQEISFLKGERIRLCQFHIYNEEVIEQILESSRLRIQERFFSSDKMAAIYLCSI